MPQKPVRVLLADDDASILEAVQSLLESEGDFKVAGCASGGDDAVLLASQMRLDLAILDISMAGGNGIEAARRIREISPPTRVVILSAHASPEYVLAALQAGALGYVTKNSIGEELIRAVRTVLRGWRYLSNGAEEIMSAPHFIAMPIGKA